MLLLNQDRDTLVSYIKGVNVLTHHAVIHNSMFFGINLKCDNILLGTYDDLEAVENEIEKINNYNTPIYVCNEGNYSNYDEFASDMDKMYDDLKAAYENNDLRVRKMEARNEEIK